MIKKLDTNLQIVLAESVASEMTAYYISNKYALIGLHSNS